MLGQQLFGAPADAIVLMFQVVLMGYPAGVADALAVHPYAGALAREAEKLLVLHRRALHIGGAAGAIALRLHGLHLRIDLGGLQVRR